MIVDLVILAVVLGFAAYGVREGFLAAFAAFIGLALGLAAAIPIATYLGDQIDAPLWRTLATVGTIAVVGNLGFVVGGILGSRARRTIKVRAARGADRAFGGVLAAVVSAMMCWMLALPLATSPLSGVAAQIKSSMLLPAIDGVVPDAARGLYSAIAGTLRDQGLPDVINPLDSTEQVTVAPPDPTIAGNSAVLQAGESVVKVQASSSLCDRSATGSAFVISDEHVMTNAHVIAGASDITLVSREGTTVAAVVYVDEQTDVAVLYSPGLDLPVLPLAGGPLSAEDDAVIAGYPSGGDFTLTAGRVASVGMISGPNFRQDATVTREAYALRASVVPGNSGGPLLRTDGTVAGVIFASAADNPQVGYALTIDAISQALEYADSTAPVASGACFP